MAKLTKEQLLVQKKQLERYINLSFIENMDNDFEIEQGYNRDE